MPVSPSHTEKSSDPTAALDLGSYRFVLLLDHDNIPMDRFAIDTLVHQWFLTLGVIDDLPTIVDIIVRAYGGWFEETISSSKRYEAHDFYQSRCPALLRLDGKYARILFSFADDLLISKPTLFDPGQTRITHTVSSRTTKKDFILSKTAPTCSDAACEIRNVRRWFGSDRACLKAQCPISFSTTFVRKEQKQVDMHIAVDLIALAMRALDSPHETLCVGMASDDLDLIPAIATAMQVKSATTKITMIRFRAKGSYLDSSLRSAGAYIANIP